MDSNQSHRDSVIYLNPATQYANTGDVLINKSLIDILRPYGKIIVDDLGKPAWFLEQLLNSEDSTLSSTRQKTTIGLIKANSLANSEKKQFVVFTPGHLSRKGLGKLLFSIKVMQRLWKYKRNNVAIIRLGFSIGPFDFLNGLIESINSRFYDFYLLRDSDSLALAKKFKFKNVGTCPDLSWAFDGDNEKVDIPAEIIDYTLISFRGSDYGDGIDNGYFNSIAEKLEQLVEHTPSLAERPIMITYQVAYDKEVANLIYQRLKTRKRLVYLMDEQLSILNMKGVYSKASVVISNRLHVLLPAIQSGVLSMPLIDISKNGKIYNLYKDNGLSELIININRPLPSSIEQVENNIKKAAEFQKRFKTLVEKNRSAISETVSSIFS